MRNLILIFLLMYVCSSGKATSHTSSKTHWKKNKQEVYTLSEIEAIKSYFNLTEFDHLSLKNSSSDNLGFEHHTFTQLHKNIPVENTMLLVHEKDGFVELSNGNTAHNFDDNNVPSISEADALIAALNHINAKTYAWQLPEYEQAYCKTTNNQKSTFYPTAQIVWHKPSNSKPSDPYKLSYKFDIYSIVPQQRQNIYINATNGQVIDSLSRIANCNSTLATAETNYNGTVSFDVCSEQGVYWLKNSNRVEVFDAKESHVTVENKITDTDNHFENDKSANEVFWATQKMYDYFKEKFNRNGIDDNDMPILSWVHYVEESGNRNIAQWNGNWMLFGDGDGNTLNSHTSIDIVAHEMMHGITEFTRNLIYINESGALNESFSDIFGEVIEAYVKDENDWLVGADMILNYDKTALRNLSNPKDKKTIYQQPDTYKGVNWWTGLEDNGGVHYNSGVQNFWFYLLSEGGRGVNDNGYFYGVEPIGMEKAAAIAYRNLCYYLTSNAVYEDAKNGAIQAAIDLFGENSFEALQTELAWRAVGVGKQTEELPGSGNELSSTTDSLALIALYYATNVNNTWINDWDLTKPMDQWFGVDLNPDSRRVIMLKVFENGLTGSIPKEIGNLTELEELVLNKNSIIGSIPKSINNLKNAHYIDLSNNQFSGTFPEIDSYKLLELHLQNNQLEGNLTPLHYVTNLEYLDVANNKLSGSLYLNSFLKDNLHTLNVAGNKFEGDLSYEIAKLPSIKNLYLNNNLFSGELASEFAMLSNLETLQLQNNLLSGCINTKFSEFCNNNSIAFDISNNNFDTNWNDFCNNGNGTCPPKNCRVSDSLNLLVLKESINVDDFWDIDKPINEWNGIELNEDGCVIEIYAGDHNYHILGEIPLEIGNFKHLESLAIIERGITNDIPKEIGQLQRLRELDLTSCGISGQIPSEIGNLKNLTNLKLNYNDLSGELPVELNNLINLEKLNLNSNNLSGSLDEQLKSLNNLNTIDLSNNLFTGEIVFLKNFPFLKTGILSNNKFNGEIENWLADFENLGYLGLDDNNFTGNFPLLTFFGNESATINISNNNLEGCYPYEAKNLCSKYNDSFISYGNNFTVSWSEFCDIGNQACSSCRAEDSLALVKIHQSLTKNSKNYTFWDFTEPMEFWQGIELNEYGCVKSILIEFDIIGTLPPEIGDLQNLESLTIYGSNLNGEIPIEICNLPKLTYLNLKWNNLTGEIPQEIGNLKNLTNLNLGDNNLSGKIPLEIGDLSKLEGLHLAVNNLTGNLPAILAKNKNLTHLDVSVNNLSGCLHPKLKQLCDIFFGVTIAIDADVEQNNFDSTWEDFCFNDAGICSPVACRNTDSLTLLSFYNRFTDLLDWEIDEPLDEWTKNSLYTSIILNYEGCVENLYILEKPLNTGFPAELLNLNNLVHLRISWGGLIGEIPIDIDKLSNLEILDLSFNSLTGEIPSSVYSMEKLSAIDLDYNELTGSLSSDLTKLENLYNLDIQFNNFSGCFRPELKKFCTTFYDREISIGNTFNSSWDDFCDLGSGVCSCRYTDSLTLIKIHESLRGENGDNFWAIHAPIDFWDGVALNENGCVEEIQFGPQNGLNFNTNLPAEIGDLESLVTLQFASCNLTGEIPKEIGNLTELEILSLGNNELEGNIPKELSQLKNLNVLMLGGNNFQGTIPSYISEFEYLDWLELDNNHLTGAIPTSFANSQLTILNIENNQLSGCYMPELNKLCSQLNSEEFNTVIDKGNNFNATWDDFCNSGAGTCTEVESCLHTDSLALIDIYNAIEGLTWDLTQPINTWEGISLDNNACVTELNITTDIACGNLDPSVGKLSQLEKLIVSGTILNGEIPKEIGDLTKLRHVDLSENEFAGNVPPKIGALQNLNYLNLSFNYLEGELPVELGQLENLNYLNLGNNELRGNIPSSYFNLTNFTDVILTNNKLTGCFDESLSVWCNPSIAINIDEGNSFDTTYDSFCLNGKSACNKPMVWPGDMDNNGIVNSNDLLYYGLATGRTGEARLNASVQWQGEEAEKWSSLVAGVNCVYQDANGDGIVDEEDAAAIKNNYGKKHQISNRINSSSPVKLELELISSSKIGEDRELIYQLYIKNNSGGTPNIYGLSSHINFSDFVVKEITTDFSESSLAPKEYFSFFDKPKGMLDISLTRIDNINIRVEESLATLIVIIDDVPTDDPPKIRVQAGNFTTVNGGLNGIQSSSYYSSYNNNPGANSALQIQVNTSNEYCFTSGSASAIIGNGIEPYTIKWSNGATDANIRNVDSGTYSVHVTDATGSTAQVQFVIYSTPPVYNQSGTLICGTTCPDYLLPIASVKSGVYTSAKEINSSIAFTEDQIIEFKAGESILLDKGFYIESGVEFSAEIEDCE